MKVKVKPWNDITLTLGENGQHLEDPIGITEPMKMLCKSIMDVHKREDGYFYTDENPWAWHKDWLEFPKEGAFDNATQGSGLPKLTLPKGATLKRPPEAFTEFLQNAIDLEKQRGKDYDSPDGERSAARIAEAFNAITGHDLTESEVWLILTLLKQVRQWSNTAFHRDSAEDQVTYTALMSESLAAGKKSTKR